MVMDGALAWGGEHTIQCTDDVSQYYTPETYIIILTNVTPITSIEKEIKYFHNNREILKVLGLQGLFQYLSGHKTRLRNKQEAVALLLSKNYVNKIRVMLVEIKKIKQKIFRSLNQQDFQLKDYEKLQGWEVQEETKKQQ